jgi:hypothetical protein
LVGWQTKVKRNILDKDTDQGGLRPGHGNSLDIADTMLKVSGRLLRLLSRSLNSRLSLGFLEGSSLGSFDPRARRSISIVGAQAAHDRSAPLDQGTKTHSEIMTEIVKRPGCGSPDVL